MIARLIRIVAFGGTLAIPALSYAQAGPPGPPPEEGNGDFAKVHVACAADVERLCKETKAGRGHVHACLKEHEAALSDGCKAALQEAHEHRHPRS